jgi:hypothetical protein
LGLPLPLTTLRPQPAPFSGLTTALAAALPPRGMRPLSSLVPLRLAVEGPPVHGTRPLCHPPVPALSSAVRMMLAPLGVPLVRQVPRPRLGAPLPSSTQSRHRLRLVGPRGVVARGLATSPQVASQQRWTGLHQGQGRVRVPSLPLPSLVGVVETLGLELEEEEEEEEEVVVVTEVEAPLPFSVPHLHLIPFLGAVGALAPAPLTSPPRGPRGPARSSLGPSSPAGARLTGLLLPLEQMRPTLGCTGVLLLWSRRRWLQTPGRPLPPSTQGPMCPCCSPWLPMDPAPPAPPHQGPCPSWPPLCPPPLPPQHPQATCPCWLEGLPPPLLPLVQAAV